VLATLPAGDPVVVVPMYAADSAFTHALSRAVVAAFTGGEHARDIRVLAALDGGVLAGLSCDHVLAHTTAAGWHGPNVALVLAAHGTVLNPRTPVSTGFAATTALCDAIADRLKPHFGMVVKGWLNHTRGGRWTEPAIDEALAGVAATGYTRVVYYPYGFLADNAETELEGRIALHRLPNGMSTLHLPCLNDSPALAEAIARAVNAGCS
jgi:protoheme ferro-lyase